MGNKAQGRNERNGISIIELFKRFSDDQAAREWFESVRWQHGRFCPHCGHAKTMHRVNEKPLPYRCSKCKGYFSVKTGSVMHRSKISLQKWAIAIYLMNTSLKGVSSMKLHRELGISQPVAWKMANKIRQGWDYAKPNLEGQVEVYETYFGGRESNKHASQKLRAGRGAVRKEAVRCVKECDGELRAKHVRYTTAESLQGHIHDNEKTVATVFTDEHKGYVGFDLFLEHQAIKHSAGEYVNGMENTNGIESVWALMKGGYAGTYHKLSHKQLHRYVSEFAGRHNARGMNTFNQMERETRNFEGKQLPYTAVIADNGLAAETV